MYSYIARQLILSCQYSASRSLSHLGSLLAREVLTIEQNEKKWSRVERKHKHCQYTIETKFNVSFQRRKQINLASYSRVRSSFAFTEFDYHWARVKTSHINKHWCSYVLSSSSSLAHIKTGSVYSTHTINVITYVQSMIWSHLRYALRIYLFACYNRNCVDAVNSTNVRHLLGHL